MAMANEQVAYMKVLHGIFLKSLSGFRFPNAGFRKHHQFAWY
jgi:hypothetical protein